MWLENLRPFSSCKLLIGNLKTPVIMKWNWFGFFYSYSRNWIWLYMHKIYFIKMIQIAITQLLYALLYLFSQKWRAFGANKPTSVFASVDLELGLWELGVLLLPSTPGDDGLGGRSLPSTGVLTYFVLFRLSSLPAPNNLSFSCSLQIHITQDILVGCFTHHKAVHVMDSGYKSEFIICC